MSNPNVLWPRRMSLSNDTAPIQEITTTTTQGKPACQGCPSRAHSTWLLLLGLLLTHVRSKHRPRTMALSRDTARACGRAAVHNTNTRELFVVCYASHVAHLTMCVTQRAAHIWWSSERAKWEAHRLSDSVRHRLCTAPSAMADTHLGSPLAPSALLCTVCFALCLVPSCALCVVPSCALCVVPSCGPIWSASNHLKGPSGKLTRASTASSRPASTPPHTITARPARHTASRVCQNSFSLRSSSRSR